MANFVGFALNTVDQELGNHHRKLEQLWLVGHPGKLAKILENHWDTHSGVSPMAMEGILELAKVFGMKPSLLEKCKDATTVEAIIQQFGKTPESSQFWQLVEQRITEKVQSRLQHVLEVRTLLFDMHRNPLGLPLTQSYE
jgi:cobalt-precorrin-5B (C1)-methyltransferase